MKKLLIGLAALSLAAPAQAMTYFLIAEWTERGDRFCRYDNGSVLNVGARLCPLSIKAP